MAWTIFKLEIFYTDDLFLIVRNKTKLLAVNQITLSHIGQGDRMNMIGLAEVSLRLLFLFEYLFNFMQL